MTDLEWQRTSEGFECEGYFIRRLAESPEPRWRLEAGDRSAGTTFPISEHGSLREAKVSARLKENDRIRRTRVTAHLAVGTVALLVFVVLVADIGNLFGYVAALFFLFVGLRSMADAVGVSLADAWGWTRDKGGPEVLSWYDRAVFALFDGLRRRSATANHVEASSVIVLPPE